MTSFCGCCGHEMPGSRSDWCRRCEAHVLESGPFESRTFFAQHKRECPWQIGAWDSSSARPMEPTP